MNSVSQLLMESVIPPGVRGVMKKAIERGTFGYEYEQLVRSRNFSHLSNYQVDVLVTNMMASQRFIKAALVSKRAKISDRGFIRLMNNMTRLVLDRMTTRKARNKFNDHVHATISDMSRKQWLELMVQTRARAATRPTSGYPSRRLRRRLPHVSDMESSGSVLSFYQPQSDCSSTCISSDSGLTVSQSDSEENMHLVSENAANTEPKGDAQYRTASNILIRVDVNDPSTFHHEEIFPDAGDFMECFPEASTASLTSLAPANLEISTIAPVNGCDRKRKLCSPVTDGDVKRTKMVTLPGKRSGV